MPHPNLKPERRIDIITAINELDLGGGSGSDYEAGDAISIADDTISVVFASDPDFMEYMGADAPTPPEPQPGQNGRTWGDMAAHGFLYPIDGGELVDGNTWGKLAENGCAYYREGQPYGMNETWGDLSTNGFAI